MKRHKFGKKLQRAWCKHNIDQLTPLRGEWIALHPSLGILFHSPNKERLDELNIALRRQIRQLTVQLNVDVMLELLRCGTSGRDYVTVGVEPWQHSSAPEIEWLEQEFANKEKLHDTNEQ